MVENEENGRVERRLPEWLKRPLGSGQKFNRVVGVLKGLQLATVCDGAGCPNRGECYSAGTATFMIMGEVCTRNCEFCLVRHGQVEALSDDEPGRVAEAVQKLGLRHVVITSVTRDDLADGGAGHFARTVEAIRCLTPSPVLRTDAATRQDKVMTDAAIHQDRVTIEVLTPDFRGDTDCLDVVCEAGPDVFNHNIETVWRLTKEIRSGADYERSLGVLRYVAGRGGRPVVKSGLMLGLGEDDGEIIEALRDLRRAGVEMLTVGQYLRPGKPNRQVQRYYRPEEFEQIRQAAVEMGFSHVASGPFVRSSYHAEKGVDEWMGGRVNE
jgi:lipoic acid synthetase